jgi:hypothetical protein
LERVLIEKADQLFPNMRERQHPQLHQITNLHSRCSACMALVHEEDDSNNDSRADHTHPFGYGMPQRLRAAQHCDISRKIQHFQAPAATWP